MFERRDVWELSEQDLWHEIIWWYARAVTAMQGRGWNGLLGPYQLASPRRDPRHPHSAKQLASGRHLARVPAQ